MRNGAHRMHHGSGQSDDNERDGIGSCSDARAAKAAARARPRTRKLIDDDRAVVEAPAMGD